MEDEVIEADAVEYEVEYEVVLDAHTYLRGIYQGRWNADHTRMRAAIACLPFEKPKLSVAASVDYRGMGDRIDRARAKLIEHQATPQSAAVANAERERTDRG
jgi:hypothetical protein